MVTSNRFQYVRAQVLFSCHTQLRIAESKKNTHTPAPFSLATSSSTPQRRAVPSGVVPFVRCRALPCCAMLCRALQCFLFRTYQTTTLASIQRWREPACISSSILYCSLHFPLFFGLQQTSSSGTYAATNSSTAVACTSMSVVEPRAQQSTAQSPLHKAANQIRADQSTYQNKCVRTCILRPVCFPGAWSSWPLQVACLHLKCWTICLICLSLQSILSCERAEPPATRSALYLHTHS